MINKPRHFRLAIAAFSILLGACLPAVANPPDLTDGGTPDNSRTTNLGPTGVRGWVYHVNSGGRRADSSEARQILVTNVAAGSPAAGILAPDDVILGADGTGLGVVQFSYDARKEFADAINDAEARAPATLSLLRWRDGTTTTVTLTLQTMGAYSATAPYNCPKSALILSQGLQAIMSGETAGRYSFGTLSLLAANDPSDPDNAARMARAQNEARALIPSAAQMEQMMSDERDATSMIVWQRGHTLIVLAEYYLLTGDTEVLPAIEAYAVNIARNSSLFGTMGHIFAEKNLDGSDNGPMGGVYGPVNNAGMPAFLGLILARKCGIDHPSVDPAIERMNLFYGYYIGKGTVPYGEHEPAWNGHENNGKSGLAALCYTLQDDRVDEGKYYAKMATAAPGGRESGHTGAYFNYVWSPLGAAAGGEEAAASHFAGIRWMLDLNRRWDGNFDYDCLNGEGPNSGSQYNNFRMSTAALLTYALPLRQIRITGYGPDPARWLTRADVAEAAAADGYDPAPRTIEQLIADLGSWSPAVQRHAANQLATRSIDSATLDQITALANDPDGDSRIGACLTLGRINNSTTANARAATLAALLTDPENHVRFMAAEGMRYLPQSAQLSQLEAILIAAADTAKPLFPLDEEDPLHFAHGRLCMLLFYSGTAYGPRGVIWGNRINGVDRELLYPAIRAVARNPVGLSRSTLQQTYLNLTAADVDALADTIVDSIYFRSPSDKMFSAGVRTGGLQVLEKYNIAEGVPLSIIFMIDDARTSGYNSGLKVLENYAGSSTTVLPDPDVIGFCQSLLSSSNAAAAQAVLDAIAADTDPAPLTPFKSIQSTTTDAASLTLPANQTTLRVAGSDLAQGDSVFTWRKVHGIGEATFTPNGTTAAADTVIQFDNQPGQYLFEVTMSDSSGLTEVHGTVAVTLYDSDGTLPPNDPPIADPQSIQAMPGSLTPITLTGIDPEGHPLVFTVTGMPAHGTLTGTAPDLIYLADSSYTGPDSFTFEVMDTEGQVDSATISIDVTTAGVELFVYEPFDYPVGPLAGNSGGTGMTGAWADGPEAGTAYIYDETTATDPVDISGNGNQTLSWDGIVDNLPTTPAPPAARFVGLTAFTSSSPDKFEAYRPLAQSAGEMAGEDGVLWASVVWHQKANNYGSHVGFALGTDCFNDRSRKISTTGTFGSGAGNAIGVGGAINTTTVAPVIFNGGNIQVRTTDGAANTSLSLDNIIILKFVFGETDTVYAYSFTENQEMTEAAFDAGAVSATGTIDENSLNIVTYSQTRGQNAVDEIRIGNSFASVIGIEGSPPDPDPPTLLAIADDRGGETMQQGETVSFTLTFSEAMDAATIDASHFGNAGDADISIDAVNQPLPDIVTVQVTPLTTGTIQFQILQDAVLTDLAGNPLDTTEAITDDTVITVNAALVDVPFVIGMPLADAEDAITAAGLVTGTVTSQHHESIPEGEVISQNPSGGTSISFGSSVDLIVSIGQNIDKTFAIEDIAISGTVTNSHVATHTSNNSYQSIQEIQNPITGPAGNRVSLLEHKWRFEVPAADTLTFHIEAHHTANTENDHFTFAYSTTGVNGTFHDMLTVTKTSDDNTIQSFELPPGTSGTIHIRVIDTDRTPGNRVLDTIFIDHMYFQASTESGPTMTTVPNVVGMTQATAEAEITAADLIVGTVTTQHSDTVPEGDVISQNPSGGSSVVVGSSVDLVVSLGVLSHYQDWAATHGLTGADAEPGAILQSDGLTNLQKFAMGMDPSVATFNSVQFVIGGAITAAGSKALMNLAQPGQPHATHAVFPRRKDYQAAGLIYTILFSADLRQWTQATEAPTVLTDENSEGDIEVVGIPFSNSVPVEIGGDPLPARFMKLSISME